MPARLGLAAPVVGRSARLHQDRRRGLLAEVSAKSLPRESMPLTHLARGPGDGHLEHRLRHVHRDRRRIHRTPPSKGLLHARRLGHTMPFKSREESIPSLERAGTTGWRRGEGASAGRSTPSR